MTEPRVKTSDLIEFQEALGGATGELDSWLEIRDEDEIRPIFMAAIQQASQQHGALVRIAQKLRKAGASIPFPPNEGNADSAIRTGMSIALLLVEEEIEACP